MTGVDFVRGVEKTKQEFMRNIGVFPSEIRFVDLNQMVRLMGDQLPDGWKHFSTILGMRCTFSGELKSDPDIVLLLP